MSNQTIKEPEDDEPVSYLEFLNLKLMTDSCKKRLPCYCISAYKVKTTKTLNNSIDPIRQWATKKIDKFKKNT